MGETTVPSTISLNNLPDWMNAMAVKEFRQAFRARALVLPLILLHIVGVIAVGFEFFAAAARGLEGRLSGVGVGILWLAVYAALLYFLPLRAFTALVEEKDGRNNELLLTGSLTTWQIVLGKWFVQAAFAVLILGSLLPYFIVSYTLGATGVGEHLGQAFSVFLASCAISAIVIGASGYRTFVGRLFAALAGAFSFYCANSWGANAAANIPAGELLMIVHVQCVDLATGVLYVILGLQIARSLVRPFHRTYDVGGVAWFFLILAPIALGLLAFFPYGMLPFLGVLCWIAYALDRKSDSVPPPLAHS